MRFIQEFREFALKGNMLDLAIGVIIGTAFGKVVSSLVADIFMPILGLVIGGIDFRQLHFTLKAAQGTQAAVILNYGIFIQSLFDFFIIALSIFVFVHLINKLRKQQPAATPEPAKPSEEALLLTEIRDLLKKK